MKKETAILIIFGIVYIIFMSILLYNIIKPQYELRIIDCKLNKTLNSTCSDTKPVGSIILENKKLTANELNHSILNERCYLLKENIWGCGEYLVKYG